MSMLGLCGAVYLPVAAVILLLVRLSLRSEPTAHGQIVGRQLGLILAIFWPLVLIWIAIVGVRFGLSAALRLIRGAS